MYNRNARTLLYGLRKECDLNQSVVQSKNDQLDVLQKEFQSLMQRYESMGLSKKLYEGVSK